MKNPIHPAACERGAALVAALLFLVILTLLGTTGVMNNTLQERMAGNARNRDLAFQAAEHGIDAANTWMMTKTKATMRALVDTSGTDLIANDGVRAAGEAHANDAGYWQDPDKWSTDVISPPDNLSNVVTQPKYVVERLPSYTDNTQVPPLTYDYYRVTSRGVGGAEQAAVILQTLYKFE
jgi:type IV pilus assembly protein PilX